MNAHKSDETIVDRLLVEASRILGKKLTLAQLANIQDSEVQALSISQQEEFKALMGAVIITPELMFSPELNAKDVS